MKKVWKWLSGKKTAIGYLGVQFCITGFAKTHIDVDVLELLQIGFTAIGGLGVAHKVTKSNTYTNLKQKLK